MKNKRKKAKNILQMQYLIGSFVLVLVLTFSFIYIFELARQPYKLAREKATEVARQYADLEELTNFSIYNGKETYYSVLGKNHQQEEIGVLISTESNQVYLYQLNQGTSQSQAKEIAKDNGAGEIDRVTLGYLDNQPIWEVKSGKTYYIVGWETASLISKEGL